ncbi:kinase-like protein [Athelia psychrophila]|uniref:Kinase-like protein n=1 Tax=Athelia psychrophila TaxID=1759441 RepID=A0A166TAX5_9AGAM|nr:kinase-like protein [Fibularhizoctonia sp. CBS 109695]
MVISSLSQFWDLLKHPGTPLNLSEYVTYNDGRDLTSGGFGDVRKGRLNIGPDTSFVAVKSIRLSSVPNSDQERMNLRLRREVKVWNRLKHENIVRLLGTTQRDSCVGMVSPWMAAGDLHSFVRSDISLSLRRDITCDAARGLAYLHSKDIIHGDLTCKNILIDNQGKACITDFGLSILKAEFEGTHYMTSTAGGAIRYRAPELFPGPSNDPAVLNGFTPVLTPACDIWSLASVILQTLTGVVPYHNIKDHYCVLITIVLGGIRPPRLEVAALTDEYWNCINTMWGKPGTPSSRPRAEQAYTSLLGLRDTALDQRGVWLKHALREVRRVGVECKRWRKERQLPLALFHVRDMEERPFRETCFLELQREFLPSHLYEHVSEFLTGCHDGRPEL